jgi:hypothetical protein
MSRAAVVRSRNSPLAPRNLKRRRMSSKAARDRCSRKNAGSFGAWSRNFSKGAVSGSAAAASPDFIRATSAEASSRVRA